MKAKESPKAVLLVSAAIACGVVASFVFAGFYPWSDDPSVNPFAQTFAMLIYSPLVGFATFAAIVAVGVIVAP